MSLLRPLIEQIEPYIPGEQPRIKGLIKLNTNENPYGPSPKVLAAIKAATDDRLRLYPNPTAQALRERLAKLHGCKPDNILVGNGSDEILALASRAFVEPANCQGRIWKHRENSNARSKSTIQFFDPSYSLYPVLAAIHGANALPVPLREDFRLPTVADLRKIGIWDFRAALTYITTPNAPSGTGYASSELKHICRAQQGVVLLDEAYVDFAAEHAMPLALELPNVLVARTFSKSYSLCFQRIGYVVGSQDIVSGLHKIRDSYNVNGLGQIAALATLDDLDYYRTSIRRVVVIRERLRSELTAMKWTVLPSQANFIFVKPPRFPASEWLTRLREYKILVRWFPYPRTRDYLRISIGTETQMDALIQAVRKIIRC
jgi:histidinol-phosphate aminotransferase